MYILCVAAFRCNCVVLYQQPPVLTAATGLGRLHCPLCAVIVLSAGTPVGSEEIEKESRRCPSWFGMLSGAATTGALQGPQRPIKARSGFRRTESDIILVRYRNGFERKMELR